MKPSPIEALRPGDPVKVKDPERDGRGHAPTPGHITGIPDADHVEVLLTNHGMPIVVERRHVRLWKSRARKRKA
ncbi:MAG: hypothetical protein KGL39_47690 [Patescibacteria group bacterium]|nr:hypothetical protein [Patescibacteria group bacterium]